ncbi:MAG: hypothetical protein FJY98_01370 [Candidatus Liptonbacteria bacterium]|nr:hypothetical protein [Candidatus Liptonbacteria bacterium]
MRRLSLFFSCAIIFLSFGGAVHAKTETPGCTLETQSFSALQKSKISDSVHTELQTRKALLRNVLECLEEEVRTDRTALERTEVKEANMQAVRTNFMASLEAAAQYYEDRKESISNAGLRSAKDIAANAREWRTNTFAPQQTKIRAFITWTNNEEFLTIANRRLEELKRSVQLLRIVDHLDEIQTLLEDADRSYRTAVDFHGKARNAFLNGLDPANSIKLSLEALAKTYHSFIELSDTINSLLPHGKEKK